MKNTPRSKPIPLKTVPRIERPAFPRILPAWTTRLGWRELLLLWGMVLLVSYGAASTPSIGLAGYWMRVVCFLLPLVLFFALPGLSLGPSKIGRISWILIVIILSGLGSSYFLDMPYALQPNRRPHISGRARAVSEKQTGSWRRVTFQIGAESFRFYASRTSVQEDQSYSVIYLPRTRWVVRVTPNPVP